MINQFYFKKQSLFIVIQINWLFAAVYGSLNIGFYPFT